MINRTILRFLATYRTVVMEIFGRRDWKYLETIVIHDAKKSYTVPKDLIRVREFMIEYLKYGYLAQ